MEETEIIDIKTENQLLTTWARFIHPQDSSVAADYSPSIHANYLRRSLEAYWQSLIEPRSREENSIPRLDSIAEYQDWFAPLTERACAASRT